jgi:hypothetical protein
MRPTRLSGTSWLVLVAWGLLAAPAYAQPAASGVAGEYFVTKNADPICVPFARNLNLFRRLDFDVCHPRFSEKYPQFTRPVWEEIPFDLALAERIFKSHDTSPPSAEMEHWWQVWLRQSEPLCAAGKVKLWRTRIDIDGDGGMETIVRLYDVLAPSPGERDAKMKSDPCPYRDSQTYMLESSFGPAARRLSANSDMMKYGFNLRAAWSVTDIIHFSDAQAYPGESNRYYSTDRLGLPSADGLRIGATRGLKVYKLFNMGAGEVCWIDWVPTGRYRPLRPQ